MARTLRITGWTFVSFGVLILLYLVYLLFFTNYTASRAQDSLSTEWLDFGGSPEEALPGEVEEGPAEPEEPVTAGDAYAAMWFQRPGDELRPVHKEVLYIVEGVTLDHLKRGPGHYPRAAGPGGQGNFAISGHRTTYGAPFYHLDQLREGDEIHVVDRDQRSWVYRIVRNDECGSPLGAGCIVAPTDTWVVEPDPLGNGRPMLTLTTCHPRFSAAQRLVYWAELDTSATT